MYIRNGRNLMGGLALIIVGAILTSMLQSYFDGEYTGAGVLRSRWWWEIVLNLQILSAALMWFCYVDRVADSTGVMKRVMAIRMAAGLIVILLPLWMALLSAYLNWFVERPPLEVISLMMYLALIFWGIAIFLPRFLILRARAKQSSNMSLLSSLKPRAWYSFLPVYVLLLIWFICALEGTVFHYHYAPLMLYFQAAVPFLESGIGRRKLDDAVPNS